MLKLIILRGVSGSSKSTWAKNFIKTNRSFIIVSRDAIRFALYQEWYGGSIDEDLITKVEHDAIRRAFASGHDVISDNTNIVQRSVRQLVNIAHEFDAEIEIKQFDIDVETAWTRCESRRESTGKDIPRHVLESQYERLRKNPTLKFDTPPKFEPYVQNWSLPGCLVVDIDGTLAHHVSRSPYDETRVLEDDICKPVRQIVNSVYDDGLNVVILSGRSENCRKDTTQWLDEHGVKYDSLFMRAAGDQRVDSTVKMELFNENLRHNYNIIGIVDDRPSVARSWRKHGIFTFQVGDPTNEF